MNKLTWSLIKLFCILGMITIFIFIVFIPPAKPKYPMVSMINTYRTLNGEGKLVENDSLDMTAHTRACYIRDTGLFSHLDGDGQLPWKKIRKIVYFDYLGENLARDFPNDVEVFDALIVSPTHRENILGEFSYVGIGRCGNVVVQHFGK